MYAGEVAHKHGENDLSTEHQIAELPMCPFCKGGVQAQKRKRYLQQKVWFALTVKV